MSTAKILPRWPLYLIAAPAAVAVWSGWVGLGQLCGFGIIHPLPGIWDAATVNTAVTLPIGVEAYGAYALGAWLSPGVPRSARRFAKWRAIGSLTLGMLGQVAYHLLSAAHAVRAPWPVVVLVSSLPVIVLGFGAALSHLLRGERSESEAVSQVRPKGAPEPLPAPAPESAPKAAPRATSRPRPKPGVRRIKAPAPAMFYAAELAAGELPSLRKIRADLHVGQERAKTIRGELKAAMTEGNRRGSLTEALGKYPRKSRPPDATPDRGPSHARQRAAVAHHFPYSARGFDSLITALPGFQEWAVSRSVG